MVNPELCEKNSVKYIFGYYTTILYKVITSRVKNCIFYEFIYSNVSYFAISFKPSCFFALLALFLHLVKIFFSFYVQTKNFPPQVLVDNFENCIHLLFIQLLKKLRVDQKFKIYLIKKLKKPVKPLSVPLFTQILNLKFKFFDDNLHNFAVSCLQMIKIK